MIIISKDGVEYHYTRGEKNENLFKKDIIYCKYNDDTCKELGEYGLYRYNPFPDLPDNNDTHSAEVPNWGFKKTKPNIEYTTINSLLPEKENIKYFFRLKKLQEKVGSSIARVLGRGTSPPSESKEKGGKRKSKKSRRQRRKTRRFRK